MRTPVQLVYRIGVLSALSTACTGGTNHRQARVDTALVFVQPSGSSRGFPQVQDSSRVLPDGSVLPDPTAPPCAPAALPDTQGWPRSSNAWSNDNQRTLSVRLPKTFSPVSTPGRWEQPRSATPLGFPSNFSVSISRSRGYPSSSFSGGVRQVRFYECKLQTPRGPIQVASFVVEWSIAVALPTHFVVARAPLPPDGAISVLGEAHDSLTQAEFVAALRTIVLSQR